jgi:hypothetical protein
MGDSLKIPIFKIWGIIMRFLGFIGPEITGKFFKNNTILINSTRAIDWGMKCYVWI